MSSFVLTAPFSEVLLVHSFVDCAISISGNNISVRDVYLWNSFPFSAESQYYISYVWCHGSRLSEVSTVWPRNSFNFARRSILEDGGLPYWLSGKESACQAGATCSIPGLGRAPGDEIGNPLQYSCLGNPMDRGAWRTTVHGVARSPIPLPLSHQGSP